MEVKLRWLVPSETSTKSPVLQFWRVSKRNEECAGIDYSEDGEWVDVPIVVDDEIKHTAHRG